MKAGSRRQFVQQSLGAALLSPAWKNAPSRQYLAELGALMRVAPVPGAVIGAVRGHRTAWIAPLGLQSADGGAAVTPATVFQAASLTKQVTAYAAFALRGQGKLDFERPLVEYVDDLRDPTARTVTARHVLSHSSGFPNWRQFQPGKPIPELTPAFAPGSKYQYSGEGFFYLQRVMEQVTGNGIGQVADELVFRPLGMSSSSLVWDPGTLERTAAPHNHSGEPRKGWDKGARALRAFAAKAGKPVSALRYTEYAGFTRDTGDPMLPNWMTPNAAASMVTSAEDYARFVAAAIRNPELVKQHTPINEYLGWGLGWAIERAQGRLYLWQWGDNNGCKNFVLAEPETGDAVFVFTNSDAGARVYDRAITHTTGHDHPALFWL